MVTVKAPKQIHYWAKLAGLKVKHRSHRKSRHVCSWYSKENDGSVRLWRINMFGNLDISCNYEDFDRWANSLEHSLPCLYQIKQTKEKDFLNTVNELRRRINEQK